MHAETGIQFAKFFKRCFPNQAAFAAKSRTVSKVSVGVKEEPRVTLATATTWFEDVWTVEAAKNMFNIKIGDLLSTPSLHSDLRWPSATAPLDLLYIMKGQS